MRFKSTLNVYFYLQYGMVPESERSRGKATLISTSHLDIELAAASRSGLQLRLPKHE